MLLVPLGCASVPDSPQGEPLAPGAEKVSFSAREEDNVNPLYVETPNADYLWESIVDVIDDYFTIPREYPIQTYRHKNEDGTESVHRTEGRIDTDPVIAAGLLQPWKKNSVTLDARTEATLQSIRRYAVVRVVPENDLGFFVHVAVYNEIENLAKPVDYGASGSNLLFSENFTKLETPVGENGGSEGWIPHGRDFEMEQA